MRLCVSSRGPIPALVASMLAVCAVAPAAPAAPGEPTVFGTALFDPDTTTITLTFGGATPHYRLFRLASGHVYYEFSPARLSRPVVLNKAVGAPLIRYTVANRPTGAAVRLSFTTTRPAAPSIFIDDAARTVQIQPFGEPVASLPAAIAPHPTILPPARPPAPRTAPQTPTAAPRGAQTALGRPFLDGARGMLVVPYQGARPSFRAGVLETDRRWVYLDFAQAAAGAGMSPFGRFNGAVFQSWAMAKRPSKTPARLVTRLSMRLSAPRAIRTELHPELGQLWVILPGRTKQPPVARPLTESAARPAETPRPAETAPPIAVPAGFTTPAPISAALREATPAPARPSKLPSGLEQPLAAYTPPPTVVSAPSPTPTPLIKLPPLTQFTGARYDQARQTLLIPFTGAVPAFSQSQLSPTAVAIDFPRAALTERNQLVQVFSDHPLLARWTAREEADAGFVRVTFNTNRPGEVVVALDAARQALMLMPQLQDLTPLPPGLPSAPSTLFGRAHFDVTIGALVVPYQGATPIFGTTSLSPTYHYVEFVGAGLAHAGLQFEHLEGNPDLAHWRLSKRPGSANRVHLAVSTAIAGGLRVLDDRAQKRLLVVPAPEESPQP
jgi:hypothetical protein